MKVVYKDFTSYPGHESLVNAIAEKLDFDASIEVVKELDYTIKVVLNRHGIDGEPRSICEKAVSDVFEPDEKRFYYVGVVLEVGSVGNTRLEQQFLLDTFNSVLAAIKEVLGGIQ